MKAFVRSGVFGSNNYEELIGSLEGNEGYGRADYFLVGKDFPSYIECQDRVDEAYRDQKVQQILYSLVNHVANLLIIYLYCAEMDQDVDLKHSWFIQVQQ